MDENKNTQNTTDQLSAQRPETLNEQLNQPAVPSPSNQLKRKPSKWRYFFIVLGILQITGIAVFLLIMIDLSRSASAGASGTEFIAMALFATLAPAVGLVALINFIGLPIYLIKHKPRVAGLVFYIVSLIISTLLVLYGAFIVFQITVIAPTHEKAFEERYRKTYEEKQRQKATDYARPEITKEEAINFMQSCKADYFIGYTDISLIKNENTKSWLELAEQSSSGVEISEDSPKTYVFASKSMTTELQDSARQFRQSCYSTKKLYIKIDNWIETEYPVGTWTKVTQ